MRRRPDVLALALLPLYARGALPRALRRVVQDRLRSSSSWRQHYEQLRRRERALDPSLPSLSATQMRLLLSNVLDDVERTSFKSSSSSSSARLASMTAWMTVLLAAAVTATIFFSASVDGTTPPTSSSTPWRISDVHTA